MSLLGEFRGELDLRYLKPPTRPWWRRWLPQRRRWLLVQSFTWCGPASNPVCYQVPAGFVTDFASIPFFVFILSPTNGIVSDYGRAAVIHDFLYQRGAGFTPTVARALADQVFYEAMLCEDVIWLTRFCMWAAVRGFGWTAYQDNPPEG